MQYVAVACHMLPSVWQHCAGTQSVFTQRRFLWFPSEQRPLVLQLGGSDPAKLAAAARIAARYGYDEINLNCGCPSDRVAGAGCFGAALMLRPEVVAECCAAMRAAVPTRVTVKCRLGAHLGAWVLSAGVPGGLAVRCLGCGQQVSW